MESRQVRRAKDRALLKEMKSIEKRRIRREKLVQRRSNVAKRTEAEIISQ